MKYELIRKKGAKYHSKPSIYAMALKDEYSYCTDRMESPRAISFDYVEWKAVRLSAWAWDRGVKADTWLQNMRGTIAGFRVYIDLIDAVNWHCQLTGQKCAALLDERMIELEGFKVRAMIKNKPYEGLLMRSGRFIEHHLILKDGKKTGRYIKPYELMSVELL